jgi:hypothetical protein
VQTLIAEAEEARVLAMKNGPVSAALSAIIAMAKLAALWPEKRRKHEIREV